MFGICTEDTTRFQMPPSNLWDCTSRTNQFGSLLEPCSVRQTKHRVALANLIIEPGVTVEWRDYSTQEGDTMHSADFMAPGASLSLASLSN
jgi:hypothetical protein